MKTPVHLMMCGDFLCCEIPFFSVGFFAIFEKMIYLCRCIL